jgi:hypothetical protein
MHKGVASDAQRGGFRCTKGWLPMHKGVASDAQRVASDAQILTISENYSLLSFFISFFNLKKRKFIKESLSCLQHFEALDSYFI